MANSNTAHSKSQRIETSAEWKKKNIIQKNYMININNNEDQENLKLLENMEGKLIDKFRKIFKGYKEYNKLKS